MIILSCTLWTVLKVICPLLNVIPAIVVMSYFKDEASVRRVYLPAIGILLYLGICFIMFGSIKAARAAEIVQVEGSCSHP